MVKLDLEPTQKQRALGHTTPRLEYQLIEVHHAYTLFNTQGQYRWMETHMDKGRTCENPHRQ